MKTIRPTISPTIRVHDLEQAACLYASGFAPTSAEWRDERLFLIFPDSLDVRRVLGDFAAGALRLDPSVVIAGFRKARKRLWEEKDRRGTLR
jgi:hypothetical protein